MTAEFQPSPAEQPGQPTRRPAGESRVLILGGYGETGRRIAALLTRRTAARIVVAGRDLERAHRLADRLDRTVSGRVSGLRVDAADPVGVRAALADVDLLVNAASAPEAAGSLAQAALDSGTDWLDTQVSRTQAAVLAGLAPRIAAAGRCFVSQAGFHPGVPAALVRWAAARVDRLESAWTAGYLRPRGGIPATSSMGELLEEFRDYRARVYDHGRWRDVAWWSLRDLPVVDFGPRLGRRRTYPWWLDELEPLPDQVPGLARVGFSIAGFDPVTDLVVSPVVMVGTRVGPRAYPALARLLAWSTGTFGRGPYGVRVQAQGLGRRAGRSVRLRVALEHADAYDLTAIPAAAMVEQLLDGTARRPGLHLMGLAVDPDRLLADAAEMGAQVDTDLTELSAG